VIFSVELIFPVCEKETARAPATHDEPRPAEYASFMRWDESHESPDVIDRRGDGPVRQSGGMGGLLWLLPYLLRTPYGWVVIVGAVLFYGARSFLGGGVAAPRAHGDSGQTAPGSAQSVDVHFVGFVLDDVQQTWQKEFAASNRAYRHAKLVLYTDATQTGCGFGDAATGPFYCPADERVYLDLGFFGELAGKLGAKGQFAQAYVIAHELGHHIQKLLGTSDRVATMRHTEGATGASVRLELQADCYAGIWARSTQQRSLIDASDIDSALAAAAAVGDDRLQRMARGTVSPESWTHGSSAERTRWFKRGLEQGSIAGCDTFSANSL
jgi:predicted metalloprotease